MMRQLHKTLNLSNFKSFVPGKMHAYKDNVVVDITEEKNQYKYNTDNNHSMLPVTIIWEWWLAKDDKNKHTWHLSWHTLHKLYLFFKDTDRQIADCYLSTSDLQTAMEIAEIIINGVDFLGKNTIDAYSVSNKNALDEMLKNTTCALNMPLYKVIVNYAKIKQGIISFVDTGICNVSFTKDDEFLYKISFDQDMRNASPCESPTIYSYFEIPLMVTNSIDNLGQVTNLIEEWNTSVKYRKSKSPIVSYDGKDWILDKDDLGTNDDNTEIYKNGHTWNSQYKEDVFGNLAFNTTAEEYEYAKNQWKRSILEFNEKYNLPPIGLDFHVDRDKDISKITGRVESQLSLFQNKIPFYDELGNEIDGMFLVTEDRYKGNGYYGILRPNHSDSLSLQYCVGSTNNITEVSPDLYWGNILHTIEFYVTDSNGTRMENYDGKLKTINQINDNVNKDSYPTGFALADIFDNFTIVYEQNISESKNDDLCVISIDDLTAKWKDKDGEIRPFGEALDLLGCSLKCDIKYNIGCFLEKINGKFKLVENKYQGIEYTDTFEVTRTGILYNRSMNERYLIYQYELNLPSSDESESNLSAISMVIPNQFITSEDELFGLDEENDKFDGFREFMYSPTIREDYYLGTASQEKVSGNIYIDRGISSAFEKHLKLQEVSTLQDLENYSNGGFFKVSSSN